MVALVGNSVLVEGGSSGRACLLQSPGHTLIRDAQRGSDRLPDGPGLSDRGLSVPLIVPSVVAATTGAEGGLVRNDRCPTD